MSAKVVRLDYGSDKEVLLDNFNNIVVMDLNAKIHYGCYNKIFRRKERLFILGDDDIVEMEFPRVVTLMFNDGKERYSHFFDNIFKNEIHIDRLIDNIDSKKKSLNIYLKKIKSLDIKKEDVIENPKLIIKSEMDFDKEYWTYSEKPELYKFKPRGSDNYTSYYGPLYYYKLGHERLYPFPIVFESREEALSYRYKEFKDDINSIEKSINFVESSISNYLYNIKKYNEYMSRC